MQLRRKRKVVFFHYSFKKRFVVAHIVVGKKCYTLTGDLLHITQLLYSGNKISKDFHFFQTNNKLQTR